LEVWRRVVPKAETLFHDWKPVLCQIQQLRLNLSRPLHPLDQELGDLETLTATAGAAKDYRDVEHRRLSGQTEMITEY